MRFIVALSVLWLVSLPAAAESLQVSDAWVRASLPGQTVASAFVRLRNPLDRPLVLKTVRSPAAASVEIHDHAMVDGQMRMRRVEDFQLPASGEATFRPGERHIMLIGLVRPLQEGDTVTVKMCFDGLCSSLDMPVVGILNEGRRQGADSPATRKDAGEHVH